MEVKTCKKCKLQKPVDEFYKKTTNTYLSHCKSCHKFINSYKNKTSKKVSPTALKTQPPTQSIFSIDAKTNQPFMTVKHATKLILKHISVYGKNVLTLYEKEDIVQYILLALCRSEYDQTKSAPTTFTILVATSVLAQLYNRNKSKDRFREVPDFIASPTESVLYTDVAGVDSNTPYDFYMAKETVEEKVNKKSHKNKI